MGYLSIREWKLKMQSYEEQYRARLMEEWDATQPPESPEAEAEQYSDESGPAKITQFRPGSILRLENQQMGIYKMAVPEKDTNLVLLLGHGGNLRTQTCDLEPGAAEEIGMIPPDLFVKLQSDMRWYRDLIVFHCYAFADTVKVPQIDIAPRSAAVPQAQPQVAAAPRRPPAADGLRRGQRFQIKFGQKMWQAVYWCKDTRGDVIAHQNGGDWALMHLDLKQYAGSLRADPEPDAALAHAIEESLMKM